MIAPILRVLGVTTISTIVGTAEPQVTLPPRLQGRRVDEATIAAAREALARFDLFVLADGTIFAHRGHQLVPVWPEALRDLACGTVGNRRRAFKDFKLALFVAAWGAP
jgi:hypothetical protein